MRVLITRPKDDALRIAMRLGAMGHEAVIVPLLDLRFLDGPEVSLDGVQAVLATSANGVRALARRTQSRDTPLFAVGPQTAKTAQELGFRTVRNAKGDARALARATHDWAKPEAGTLLHVKGADGGGALAGELGRDGFVVRSEILYDVAPPEAVPGALADAVAGCDAALFFSPRSARVLKDFAKGLATEGLDAVCISNPTAAELKPLVFRHIFVAEAPNQEAMLACLSRPGV